MRDQLGAGRFCNYNRRACTFCNLERAIAEWQQFSCLAAGSLRVNTEGHNAPLQQLGSVLDGSQRFAVIRPVDRQKKALMYDASSDGNIKNLWLGNVG